MKLQIELAAALGLLMLASTGQSTEVSLTLGASTQNFTEYGGGPFTGTPPWGGYGTYGTFASLGQGACTFNGTSTSCLLSGSFSSTVSGLGSGTYRFVTTYAGNDTPLAGPNSPQGATLGDDPTGDPKDANSFLYTSIDPSTTITLTLTTSNGTFVESLFANNNFVPGTSFGFAYTGNSCTGLGSLPCSPYNVGITSGATVFAPVTIPVSFNFSPTGVPEPASLSLLGLGLAGIGFARRKRSS